MEIDPKYASVIVQRFINQVQGSTGVKVMRDGQELTYEDGMTKQKRPASAGRDVEEDVARF
jgi:hypothetical protein